MNYGTQAITDTMVQGMTPSVAVTQDADIDSGRMIGESDLDNQLPRSCRRNRHSGYADAWRSIPSEKKFESTVGPIA